MANTNAIEIILSVIASRSGTKPPFDSLVLVESVYQLLDDVQEIFETESTILKKNGNMFIIGDLHGNIDDLLRIFNKNGFPPNTSYLFLGDYVDRGKYGLEILCLLFATKILFPNNIVLIRGNHEMESTSSTYGFYDEVAVKYSLKLYQKIVKVFDFLPLGAIVANKYFCVHGGIGPNMPLLTDIMKEDKPEEIKGYFSDMLWSDPRVSEEDFTESTRGSGYFFNENALDDFLKKNNLKGIIRSHEFCQRGCENTFGNDKCVTIFSSSGYCNKKNSGCMAYVYGCGNVDLIRFKFLTEKRKKKLRFTIPECIRELSESSASSGLCSCDEDIESDSYLYNIVQ